MKLYWWNNSWPSRSWADQRIPAKVEAGWIKAVTIDKKLDRLDSSWLCRIWIDEGNLV